MSSPGRVRMRDRERTRQAVRFLFGVREGVRIALEAIRINPFRSGLTVLGVGIGVCVVVLVAALISGIRGSLQEGIEASGPRNLIVALQDLNEVQLVGDGTTPEWMRRPSFTPDQIDRVGRVPGVRGILASAGISDPSSPEGGATFRMGSTRIGGVTTRGEYPGWATLSQVDIVQGRDFVPVEMEEARAVVVVSEAVAEALVGEGQTAVGARVQLVAGREGGIPVTIIGVYGSPDQVFGEQSRYSAVVPYNTAVRRFQASRNRGEFIVIPEPAWELELVEDAVISALRTVRGVDPGEPNNFAVVRATALLEFFDRFTMVFFVVMLALSSAGLLVGGVGVVGIMLISVTERTREIGVRKALGATRGEILWQFLVEAGVLTALGAAAGLLLGGGLAWLVTWLTPVPASIPLWAVAASLSAAVITGMGFGLFPALRASRLDPVVALRHE